MFQIAGLNTLDLLLIFILFIGLIIGFIRGLGTQVVSLASIWFGLLIALWLYRPFSDYILQGLEVEFLGKTASDSLSFLTMLFICFQSVRLIIRYLTKPPEEKRRKAKRRGQVGPVEEPPPSPTKKYILGPLGAAGSMVMGLVLTVLWTAIILGVLQFFFQAGAFAAGGVSAPGMVGQIQSSVLAPYFNRVLRVLVVSVSLFVLDDTPNILEVVVQNVVAPTE